MLFSVITTDSIKLMNVFLQPLFSVDSRVIGFLGISEGYEESQQVLAL